MTIVTKYGENICQVEINQPEGKNLIDTNSIHELCAFLTTSPESKKFAVLVLSGLENMITTTGYLEWVQQGVNRQPSQTMDDENLFTQLFQILDSYPKLVIAKIDKGANGGGVGLIACADIAVTTPDATFACNDVTMGVVPSTWLPYIIKKTGHAVARDLILSGRVFDGEEAYKYNLVNYLYPPAQINSKTRELAHKLSRCNASTIKETKTLIASLNQQPLHFNTNPAGNKAMIM